MDGLISKIDGFFRFEYHFADYYAEADWNLRTDFEHPKSFTHEADGRGLVFTVGAEYNLNDNWTLDVNADVQDWRTEAGIDRTFLSSGIATDTRLNEVNWESYALMVGATCHFW